MEFYPIAWKNIVHLSVASDIVGHTFLLETFPSIALWLFLPFNLIFLIFFCWILIIWVNIRVPWGSFIFPCCLFFVYNLSLAGVIRSIALYTFCVLIASTFILLTLTLSLTPPSYMYVYTHTLSLKISNCRSNRHVTLCSKQNS